MAFLMNSIWWWMAGTAIVSIPIVIHLLHRQRTQPVLWGAMLFLRQSLLQQKRRRRVDYWLLMALRLLGLAVLVFLLAQPLLRAFAYNAIAPDTPADIGIVIDHSLSTRRLTDDGSVYARAVAAVAAFADSASLRPMDTVTIVLAERTPRLLSPAPQTRDAMPVVVERLRQEKPGLSTANIPDAIRVAREMIARGRNARKVILVLSDGQRTSWHPEDRVAWNAAVGSSVQPGSDRDAGVNVYDVSIRPARQKANLTVSDVSISPGLVGVDRPAKIHAAVTNTGSAPVAGAILHLIAAGHDAGSVTLPDLTPGQTVSREFEHAFTDTDSQWFEVRVDTVDALDADNVADASTFVWQTLPILIVDGQLATQPMDASGSEKALQAFRRSRFLATAMLSDAESADSTTLIRPTLVSIADRSLPSLDLDAYAAVVFNDVPQLPEGLQGRLLDYARAGHGLWFILGRNTESRLLRDQLAPELFRMEVGDLRERVDKPAVVEVREPEHPTLSPFMSNGGNALSGLTTVKWWAVKPVDAESKTLLATDSGDPLMLERSIGPNGGRILIWTSPVDGQSGWNNWPSLRSFAPLVNLSVYELATGWTRGQDSRRLQSGQPIVWTGPAAPEIGSAQVILPDGATQLIRPIVRDGRQILRFSETTLPGHYVLRFDPPSLPPVHFGVGIDPAELDEKTLTPDDRKWLTSPDHPFLKGELSLDQLDRVVSRGSSGLELWPYLVGLLLATLLFETLVTWNLARRQSSAAVIV